jgi:hypothetical protein
MFYVVVEVGEHALRRNDAMAKALLERVVLEMSFKPFKALDEASITHICREALRGFAKQKVSCPVSPSSPFRHS